MNENKITELGKTALEKQTENLNSDTQHRLRLAREKALKHSGTASWSDWLSWKWLSGGAAGVALASVIAFMIEPNLQSNSLSPLDDLDLLTAEVDMDLVDDLEFYQWLDESLTEGSDES